MKASFLFILVSFLAGMPLHAKPNDAKTSIDFEMVGKIFPIQQFPAQCAAAFEGKACDETSPGQYHVVRTQDEQGINHSVTTFSDSQGAQTIEESWEKDGALIKASIKNLLKKTYAEIEVKNGRAYYKSYSTANLKAGQPQELKSSEAQAEPNLTISSTLMAYLKAHFKSILVGQTVQIKLAVLDRQDSFTFNIKKIRDSKTLDGAPVAVLEMSPASLFVKLAVSPMQFYINLKTNALFAFEGRSALQMKRGDEYKPVDAKTIYTVLKSGKPL